MPRKVQPQWSPDDFVDVGPAELEPATVKLLEQIAGDGDLPDGYRDQAAEVVSTFRTWRRQELETPSTAESNAGLKVVRDKALAMFNSGAPHNARSKWDFETSLWALDSSATWRLQLAFRTSACGGVGDLPLPCVMAKRPDMVAEAIDIVLATNCAGRRCDNTAALTVQHLVELFEAMTNTTATHTPSQRGEPQSRAGQFIRAFLASVAAGVTPQTVSSILATQIRRRRKIRAA